MEYIKVFTKFMGPGVVQLHTPSWWQERWTVWPWWFSHARAYADVTAGVIFCAFVWADLSSLRVVEAVLGDPISTLTLLNTSLFRYENHGLYIAFTGIAACRL